MDEISYRMLKPACANEGCTLRWDGQVLYPSECTQECRRDMFRAIRGQWVLSIDRKRERERIAADSFAAKMDIWQV